MPHTSAPRPTGTRHPDPRWCYFFETILVVRVPGEPPFEIDLRRPADPGLGGELARRGLAGDFAVITAYNPFGEPEDAEANIRRDREMARRLEMLLGGEGKGRPDVGGSGVGGQGSGAVVRIDGRSPDGSHCEPGYGVRFPLQEASALARKFGQSAIYWWDGEVFWLVGVGEGEGGVWVRLPN